MQNVRKLVPGCLWEVRGEKRYELKSRVEGSQEAEYSSLMEISDQEGRTTFRGGVISLTSRSGKTQRSRRGP